MWSNDPIVPDEVDATRRHFLIVATGVVGAVGVIFAAVPFIDSMEPSARALANSGPVDIDISKIEPGGLVKGRWRGKPIWIVNRPAAVVAALTANDSRLRDPKSQEPQQPAYCHNEQRSIKPQTFVVVPICTHLGCIPLYRPRSGDSSIGPNWPGGFHCPCHGSLYDLAGRVFQNVPAPLNLPVPVHRYLSDSVIRIGENPAGSSSHWQGPTTW
jgi:ubiquinol-cytochrome c reductase iron-sulfur subunit